MVSCDVALWENLVPPRFSFHTTLKPAETLAFCPERDWNEKWNERCKIRERPRTIGFGGHSVEVLGRF